MASPQMKTDYSRLIEVANEGSRELGYAEVELNARLALAELEMKTGQTAAGRAHLTAIEADARAKG